MHEEINAFILGRAQGYYQLGIRENGSVQQGEAAAMLFAFACELALKGLGATVQRHNLRELFDSLPADRRLWLTERYENLEMRPLDHDIDACADIFIEIRYWHERGGGVFASGACRRLARFLTQSGTDATAKRPDRQFISSEGVFGGRSNDGGTR